MCYTSRKRTIDFGNHRGLHQRTYLFLVKKYMGVGLKFKKLQSNLHCSMGRTLDLMHFNNPQEDKSPDSFSDFSVPVNVHMHAVQHLKLLILNFTYIFNETDFVFPRNVPETNETFCSK